MKYTKEERLDIGRQIYTRELSYEEAMSKYGLSQWSAKQYVRLFRETNNLPEMQRGSANKKTAVLKNLDPKTIEDYEAMTKEQLINELVMARINEARLKKGYEVKGDGTVIQYDKKNIK